MTNNEDSCWIVIVHYNGAEWIEKCLGSFSKTKYEDNIIVVDNCSTDRHGVEIITTKFPKVTFIKLNENIGFGRANNVGIEFAIEKKTQYVFLLNQDAWICKPDTIEKLVQVADNQDNYAIVSPIHYNSDETALDEGFATYLSTSKNSQWASDTFFSYKENVYQIPFINAAAWLINLHYFQKIGLFDDAYFMYGEDVDLVNRTLFHQFKIGFTPFASICHARENRPKTINQTSLAYSEKMQFYGRYLSIVKNINWSFSKSFLKFIIEWSREIIKQIKNKFWKRTLQIISIGFKVIFQFFYIYSSRERNKRGFLK